MTTTEIDRLELEKCEAVWRRDWAAVRALEVQIRARRAEIDRLAGELFPGCRVEEGTWTASASQSS